MGASVWLWVLGAAWAADPIQVTGSGRTETIQCQSAQAVNIDGSMHHLTLTGDCGRITVEGSSIQVDADGIASVSITGSMNTVSYRRNLSSDRKLPVSTDGVSNQVRRIR